MRKKLLNRTHRLWILGCVAALTALPALAESSYSYPRVLEGPATLTAAGETEGLDLHQPILVGDRIRVPSGSRLELVLADRSLLRLGSDSEIDFERIAYSAETEDRSTVIRLHFGETQLVVPEDALGDALPQLETPGATIYVHRAGSFRITVGDGWTELVVRDGLAEMVTDRGSLRVDAGDQGWVRGGRQPRLELRVAGARDSLERWGDWLSAEAVRADVPYVDESIRYAARPLAEHGVWVEVSHRRAWRPTTVVDWRPYVRGYWRHTPIGLTWVSNDPWGHVTHHYGSWDLVPGHGWVWYPGAAYAPARVHWYWGPSYVGWCPSGYYRNHYAGHRRGFDLSFGLYGWAGGSWHPFRHWSFTLHADFGHRRQHRHVRHGAHFASRHGGPRLERGIITTEPRVRRGRHHETFADLRREADRHERQNGRPLPDVSDFIARKPLVGELDRVVLKPRPAAPKPPPRVAPPRVAGNKPLVRERPSPRADSPRVERSKPETWTKPSPRVDSPRVDRTKPEVWTKPSPRVGSPRVDRTKPEVWTKPSPRVDSPRVDRTKPAVRPRPRVDSPRVERTKPAVRPSPRVNSPRVDRTKPVVRQKPSPRVERTKPVVRQKPSPRVDRTKPVVRQKPSPRVERTKPVVRQKPSPRVERTKPAVRPRPSPRVERTKPVVRQKPSPRVERTKPAVRPRPSPRADSPRAPRPKPTVRSTPAPRPERNVDRNRSERQPRPRAQASKDPQPEKKATSRSRSRDSGSRQRDD